MAMSTQVQAQVSKRDTVVLGGNMALRRGLGGGSVTMVLRRQLSPISTVEVLAMVGLRSILSLQTSRYLCFLSEFKSPEFSVAGLRMVKDSCWFLISKELLYGNTWLLLPWLVIAGNFLLIQQGP
jgi:hypothetical protein